VRSPNIRAIVFVVLVCGGCTTTIRPPPAPAEPVSIYVTDYGRHSSLLLPDPRGHLTEYAYGDWDWFALRHTGSGDGVRALLFSEYTTLGRRQLNVDDNDSLDDVVRATRAKKAVRIEVSAARADELLRRLDQFYDQYLDTVTYSPASALWFVRYHGNYSLLHNCNHATARWLRELGCEVKGPAMFSKFAVRPPAKTSDATTAPARANLGNQTSYGRAGG
jgi:hypothetical protein